MGVRGIGAAAYNSAVRLGVNLVNFGPAASPEALARQAEDAEALGYHFVMISDHVAITPDVAARYPAPVYHPFPTPGRPRRRPRRPRGGAPPPPGAARRPPPPPPPGPPPRPAPPPRRSGWAARPT